MTSRGALDYASTLAGRLRSSSLVRASGVYGVSTVLNRAIPFLLLPVLTRYLSPEDFGKAAMFAVAVSVTLPFIGVSTDSAIGRQYFDRDRIDFARYVTNCLYILATTAAAAFTVAVLLSGRIAAAIDLPSQWVWSIVLVAAARFVVNTVLTLWQVQHRTLPYAVYSLLLTASTFALSLVFIVSLGFGWQGRVLGELLSVTALAGGGAVLLWRGGWIRGGIDRGYIQHALKFSGWIIPHLCGSVLMTTVDRFFLTNMVGVGETGLYTAAAQIAAIVTVAAQSFNLAWSPWAYERLKMNEPGAWRMLATVRRLYYAGVVVLALGLAFVAPFLFGWLIGPRFTGAEKYALWLALGQAFMAMYMIAVTPFFFAHKTHLLAIISLSIGVVSVVFNYALISLNGPIGAAQASALTMFTMFAVASPLAGRVMRELADRSVPESGAEAIHVTR
ncbi:MAG: lipopolysaccharide biosynthesis protein [Vicinamibacterales bacterium]